MFSKNVGGVNFHVSLDPAGVPEAFYEFWSAFSVTHFSCINSSLVFSEMFQDGVCAES